MRQRRALHTIRGGHPTARLPARRPTQACGGASQRTPTAREGRGARPTARALTSGAPHRHRHHPQRQPPKTGTHAARAPPPPLHVRDGLKLGHVERVQLLHLHARGAHLLHHGGVQPGVPVHRRPRHLYRGATLEHGDGRGPVAAKGGSPARRRRRRATLPRRGAAAAWGRPRAARRHNPPRCGSRQSVRHAKNGKPSDQERKASRTDRGGGPSCSAVRGRGAVDSRLAKRRGAGGVDATRPGREPPAVPRSAAPPERSAGRPCGKSEPKRTADSEVHRVGDQPPSCCRAHGLATPFASPPYWLPR